MPQIIDPAEAGFTKGRSAILNIRKALMALNYAKHHKNDDIIMISLDAEKM